MCQVDIWHRLHKTLQTTTVGYLTITENFNLCSKILPFNYDFFFFFFFFFALKTTMHGFFSAYVQDMCATTTHLPNHIFKLPLENALKAS